MRISKGRQKREAKRLRQQAGPQYGDLVPEVGLAVTRARQYPREQRWKLILASFDPPTLIRLASAGMTDGPEGERYAAALVLLTMGARAAMEGDEEGAFEATDADICRWTGQIAALCSFEAFRRMGAFNDSISPDNPFAPDAELAYKLNLDFHAAMERHFGPINADASVN